ncbi:MAG: glycosyltransferase family 2 protein [Planctomycetes bacterium]|nr:glycosyltransferase family 2 protein [Planctomycetota bacterium]
MSLSAPLTVVVPLKDEEEGLDALAAALDSLAQDLGGAGALQFVLVDDGSDDRTWELLQQRYAQRPEVQLCRHERNRGIAAAIRTGLQAARTELVASIDGDLSYDPRELPAMVAAMGDADLVTASPYHPRGGVAGVPAWRLLLSRTLSRAYRLLLRSDVHTWTSCFRVYRRASVVDLPLVHERFLGTAELLVRVLRRGGCVVEHPCVLATRRFGQSKLKIGRTILGHVRLLWQVLTRQIR